MPAINDQEVHADIHPSPTLSLTSDGKVPFPFPMLNCFSLYQKSSRVKEGREASLRRLSFFPPLSLLLLGFLFYRQNPIMEGDSGTPVSND